MTPKTCPKNAVQSIYLWKGDDAETIVNYLLGTYKVKLAGVSRWTKTIAEAVNVV